MAVESELMTAEALAALADDGSRHELVRGELRTMPPSGFEHGGTTGRFYVSLATHVWTNQLGEVVVGDSGFLLAVNPDTVLAPDVAFVREQRWREAGRVRGYWPGAPDLVVEVISPHDRYTEVEDKVATWIEHGVRLVCVVNPRRRTVAVHRPGQPVRGLAGDDLLSGEDIVPGWTLRVRDLFPPA